MWHFCFEFAFANSPDLVWLLLDSFLPSLKEFLPKEYIKNKGEKKIFQVRTALLEEPVRADLAKWPVFVSLHCLMIHSRFQYWNRNSVIPDTTWKWSCIPNIHESCDTSNLNKMSKYYTRPYWHYRLYDHASFSAGTQKLSEHDGDRSQSQLREAGQVPENLRRVILSGQGGKKVFTKHFCLWLDKMEKFLFAARWHLNTVVRCSAQCQFICGGVGTWCDASETD